MKPGLQALKIDLLPLTDIKPGAKKARLGDALLSRGWITGAIEVALGLSEITAGRQKWLEDEGSIGRSESPPLYEQGRIISALIEKGKVPALGNGWSFVIDRMPEDQLEDRIAANAYTVYFANKQIPIAGTDHSMHVHDTEHVPSYRQAFSDSDFADLVHKAAQNALGNPELESTFTGAIDGFGDGVRNVWSRKSSYEGDHNMVKYNLTSLASLKLSLDSDHPDVLSLTERFMDKMGFSYLRKALSSTWRAERLRPLPGKIALKDLE